MKLRRLLRRAGAFIAGVVIVLALLELLLRMLPVVSGPYAADPSAEWPLHREIPHSTYTHSMAWNAENVHHGRINNFGYTAPFDYEPGSGGVAVIGDSYVQALMNDYADTVQGRLNQFLDTRQNVMSFGMSGAELPHYLGTAQNVGEVFAPQWAVLVITSGDYSGGFNADPGYYRWNAQRSPPIELVPEITRSPLKKIVRQSALVGYVRGNLEIRLSDLIHLHRAADTSAPVCTHVELSSRDEELMSAYIDALPKALGLLPGRVILVFDSNRKAIYAGAPAQNECPNFDEVARNRLMALGSGSGMSVIDTTPLFRTYYETTHEQVDFLPQDGHWNPTAHLLVAKQVANVINAAPALEKTTRR